MPASTGSCCDNVYKATKLSITRVPACCENFTPPRPDCCALIITGASTNGRNCTGNADLATNPDIVCPFPYELRNDHGSTLGSVHGSCCALSNVYIGLAILACIFGSAAVAWLLYYGTPLPYWLMCGCPPCVYCDFCLCRRRSKRERNAYRQVLSCIQPYFTVSYDHLFLGAVLLAEHSYHAWAGAKFPCVCCGAARDRQWIAVPAPARTDT